MLCFIYKWMISRALDMGKAFPALVNRHMRRCRACREFARFSESLAARLTSDAPGFLQASSAALEEKIIAGLDSIPGPGARPVLPRESRKRRFTFAPSFAYAAAAAILVVVVVGAGIIFKVIPTSTPATGGIDEKTIKNITTSAFAKNPLQGIVGRMEFSVEGEMRSLEKSVKSAAGHLYSCLDFKIGAKNKKRSSG